MSDLRSFEKGSVIFVEGEQPHSMYIIKEGSVLILKDVGGKLTPVGVVSDQDFLGEITLFQDTTRNTTAIAIESTEAMVIKHSEVKKILKEMPEWTKDLMGTLGDRLNSAVDIITEHRLADYVLEDVNVTEKDIMNYKKSIGEYRERRKL